MNCAQYPSTIWQGHDKGHEWNASFPTMSSGDLPALISKWLKKREKYSRQRYLWTLCRSVVPWRYTTRFRPAVRLCQLEMVPRCFPIPCPRQDSEGEKSRPLDHMRQIPFVGTSVPPYWLQLRFSHVYIYDNVVILSPMWYVLRLEHAHGLKRYNDRGMLVVKRPIVLDSFYHISFLQFLLSFFRKRLLFRSIVDIIRSSLKELCESRCYFSGFSY